jgi:nucleoside-diphosphate-sugar epimerase
MKVFIAGATGAGGRPLVQQLLDAGHDVQLGNGYAQKCFCLQLLRPE